jgi:nucleoside-diphosphate-sugar epimerase
MTKTYVVTGATGFLGMQLVRKILKSGDIVVLIGKSKHGKMFEHRISHIFKDDQGFENIICIEADLEHTQSTDLINKVSAKVPNVDGIWHLAANLSFKEEDRKKVFATNIDGLVQMIELAKSYSAVLYYTSTAYVHGRQSGTAFETFYDKKPIFNNPYEESKYEAEKVLEKSKDLKYILFRPSILYDATGEHITNFGYYSFLIALNKLRKSFGIKPDSSIFLPLPFFYKNDSLLNLMPIDIAIDWMHEISTKEEAIMKVFHISNPKSFVIKDIFTETFQAFHVKLFLIGSSKSVAYWYFRLLDVAGFIIPPLKAVALRIYYFKWYLLEHMHYDLSNVKMIIGNKDIETLENLEKDYILKLATKIKHKLEINKKS